MEGYQLNFPVHDWKCSSNSSFSASSKMDVLFLEVSPGSVLATIHLIAVNLTNEFLHVSKEGGVMWRKLQRSLPHWKQSFPPYSVRNLFKIILVIPWDEVGTC